ncbi:Ig-like domain-containing protein [uncultured Bacteroides sp.]|uniref:Ig-like domain-containing protein n=1 Tax=uncultured Bacteroides sp. TaxID=162156 RepID=UPI002AA7AAA8|nr:Ig-like domain-containing protein [uncultured Bacteroides sp.]
MLNRKCHNAKQFVRSAWVTTLLVGALYSCANVGRPDGGPIDVTPPRFIGSVPVAGALNNTKSKIVISFDEFIKLEKANEKVVISPPQVQLPEIKANGKRVSINLIDSLKANTTYTVDFSDAIVDNNEGNPLGNFAFTFSTGGVIDTMMVSGTVLEASNLEPVKGILVGLHSNLQDSAFVKLPFDRVGRTDSRGHFSIRGVAPGKYRIYALLDADQNFAYTQKSEALAFNDSLVIPGFEERTRQDTVWKDSLTVDSIVARKYTHYLPDDVLLRSFTENMFSQYLIKGERTLPQKFSLYFAAKADTLPVIKGLNFDEKNAFLIEKTQRNDTLHYWVKDSLIYKKDTLSMSLRYLYTDTLNQLVPRTDTLNLIVRRAKGSADRIQKKKKGKGDEPDPTVFLQMTPYVPSSMDVYDSIHFVFDEPLSRYDTEAIHLKQKVDSLWKDVPFVFKQDSLELRRYNLLCNWEPATDYELSVDSMAFHGLYGLYTNKVKQAFKVRSLDEYGAIYFNVSGIDTTAFVELLDAQDKVLRRVPVVQGRADFYYLNPGKYCARLVVDANRNGKWDTGSYELKLQPEMVYYYPQIVELKALWELEQDWNVGSKPLDKQKLDELKKQKPDEDKKKQNNRNNKSSSSSGRGGFGL